MENRKRRKDGEREITEAAPATQADYKRFHLPALNAAKVQAKSTLPEKARGFD